jgi:hypothetical protein
MLSDNIKERKKIILLIKHKVGLLKYNIHNLPIFDNVSFFKVPHFRIP